VYLIQLYMIGEVYLIQLIWLERCTWYSLYDWRGVLDATLYYWRGVLDTTLFNLFNLLSVSVVSHIGSLYENCNMTSPLLFLSIPYHLRMASVDRTVIHHVRSCQGCRLLIMHKHNVFKKHNYWEQRAN
jgi:hypothetical protein